MTDSHERQRRRKISLACEPCRERKSRCDGGKPICISCQRRGLSLDHCIYTTDNARTASKDSYLKVLHDRIRYLERKLEQHGISVEPFGCETTPGLPGNINGISRLLPHQESIVDVDTSRVVGTNPLAVRGTIRRDPVPIVAPAKMDIDEVEGGLTGMGTIATEEEIDGAFDASGEFFGTSSAASFMQEAIATAKSPNQSAVPLMSPPKPEPAKRAVSGRAFDFNHTHSESFSLPPRSLADHLLERFWDKVYYLYPIFHRPAFERAYDNLWKTEGEVESTSEFNGVGIGCSSDGKAKTIIFHCALNTIFAIGCTFSDLAPGPKEAATRSFFLKSKSFVGLDLLEINNIGVVQCLLLMALFLQSTPFPSRTWNSVGVACRVAQGLGLHTEAPRGDRSQLEIEISRRTWHGCTILDMVVSMTFGRPTMTANTPPRPMPSVLENMATATGPMNEMSHQKCPSRLLFFNEYSRLCGHLKEILSKVYGGGINRLAADAMEAQRKAHDFTLILELESKLASFEASLPPILSWKKPQNLAEIPEIYRLTFETQRVVLHGRFLYLQIMLHRPILTQLCVASQSGAPTSSINDSALCNLLHTSFTIECAKTCIQAAMELIELVHKTHHTPATGYWWWDGLYACTSGLILIVSQLHPQLKASFSQQEVQRHWKFCEVILEGLGTHSTSVQKSLKLLRKVHCDVMTERDRRPRISNKDSLQDNISESAVQNTYQETPQPAIDELVDFLPFELMSDSNAMDVSFNWNQSTEFFGNDFSFEALL